MVLEANNIVAGYYKGLYVLNGVSISAKKSAITCILGPNGAGKSTLMKVIIGLVRSAKGTILKDGNDITRLEAHQRVARGVTYIPQQRSVFPYLTVEENLELGGWLLRKNKPRMSEMANKVLDRFPVLRQKRHDRAALLSGGEQRMLEFGRAMMYDPDVFLVDEPSFGLAPKIAGEVYGKLQELRDEGKTILLVDQNVREAIKISDYVYIIELGRNRMEGSKEDFELKLHSVIRSWLHI